MVLREQRPNATNALFVGWDKFAARFPGPPRFRNITVSGGTDMELARQAAEYFTAYGPDITFMQLDQVDEVGHAHGYGKYYDSQVCPCEAF